MRSNLSETNPDDVLIHVIIFGLYFNKSLIERLRLKTMKARLLLAALPCLAFARPQPLEDAVTTASASNDAAPVPSDAPLVSAVSSAVSSAGLKPYGTPLASDPITEWNALGDSFTAAIGSNGLDDYIRTSFDCERYQQSYALKMNSPSRL